MTRRRWLFDLVQHDGQELCEVPEIPVRCEDDQIAPDSHGANEEVGVRALDALGPAEVEKIRGRHVILRQKRKIGESREVSFQTRELRPIPHPGENFLPDGADDLGYMGGNEPPQFLPLRMLLSIVTPQGQRPDARIDERPQARARWRL